MLETAVSKISNAMISLLESKPLQDITVKELVSLAGVNRSSYHYHFYCLEDVVERIIDDYISGWMELYTRSRKRKREISEDNDPDSSFMLYEYIYRNRHMLKVLYDAGYRSTISLKHTAALKDYYHGTEFSYINSKGETVVLREGVLFEFKISIAACQTITMIECWIEQGFHIPPEEMPSFAKRCVDLKIRSMYSYKDYQSQTSKAKK